MMKARSVSVVLIATLMVVCSVTSAFAYTPAIIDVVIDGSGSVSNEDIAKAKLAVAGFAEALYERSQLHPGELADWLSVNFFGGDTDYQGSKFINCSNMREMKALQYWIVGKSRPMYQNTAIYTAIAKAFLEVMAHESQRGTPQGTYMKNIILITDGKDNSKDREMIDTVKSSFPNKAVNLFLIGVGRESNLEQFKNVGDLVVMIDNFDELAAILLLILEHM